MAADVDNGGLDYRSAAAKRIGFGPATRWGYSWLAMLKKPQPKMADLEQRCSSKKQYEYYRCWAYYDGGPPGALCA